MQIMPTLRELDAIFLRDVIGRAGAWTVLLFLVVILSRAVCPGCDALTGLHVASPDPSGLTLALAAWLNCLAFYFGARLPLWDDHCVSVLVGISKVLAGLTFLMLIFGVLVWMVRVTS